MLLHKFSQLQYLVILKQNLSCAVNINCFKVATSIFNNNTKIAIKKIHRFSITFVLTKIFLGAIFRASREVESLLGKEETSESRRI